MGFMDNMLESVKNSIETAKDEAARKSECEKDRSMPIVITFGYKELGIPSASVIRQQINGDTYFNYCKDTMFSLVGYEWNGPEYNNVITSTTQGSQNSETVKKGKSGKMATGAIVGTLLFPGVGTIVGAAIGAGGKDKSKTETFNESSTNQISKRVEKNTTAILKLKNIETETLYTITIVCNSVIDSQIKCFTFCQSNSTAEVSKDISDALKGIKALKELLDMGAISLEEFEEKKKQLLN